VIVVTLGSNAPFGGRAPLEVVRGAADRLHALYGVAARSRLYASPAWPDPEDPPFVNAAVALRAGPGPEETLAGLRAVEDAFGRTRARRWGPRTLDLDLIDYDGAARWPETPQALALPHPRATERLFVLRPIADLDPAWRPPGGALTVSELIERLVTQAAPARHPTEAIPMTAGWAQ